MKEGIDVAAQLAFVGINPLEFLNTHDPLHRMMLMEMGKKIYEYQRQRDQSLAAEIANQVGKLFKS